METRLLTRHTPLDYVCICANFTMVHVWYMIIHASSMYILIYIFLSVYMYLHCLRYCMYLFIYLFMIWSDLIWYDMIWFDNDNDNDNSNDNANATDTDTHTDHDNDNDMILCMYIRIYIMIYAWSLIYIQRNMGCLQTLLLNVDRHPRKRCAPVKISHLDEFSMS